ncbi:hypothetical protein [Cognatishimia sp. F0-27]|nr:hypothetical protein [Cognatishimia sp. F0-27]MCC1493354.1 hypothetical protein [Cognatishimia sp. F0-27]
MTNRLAIILGLLILGALALDYALFEMRNTMFLARKFFVLLDWLAFWR